MASGTKVGSPRVILVDDQPLVRAALQRSLPEHEIEVIGEADNGEEAIELVIESAPEVVVMDLHLPGGMSGIEITRRLATVAPLSRVLVLTGSADQFGVVEAIVAGACGYLLKNTEPAEIAAAIRAAAAGGSVISQQIAGDLLERVRQGGDSAEDQDAADAIRGALTDRELEVLRLLASGKSNNEISRILFVSPMTIKNHIANILAKLQLENRIQAAVHAVRSGIV